MYSDSTSQNKTKQKGRKIFIIKRQGEKIKTYTWLWANKTDVSSSNHNPQHQVVLKDSVGKWFPKCLDCHDTVFEF